MICRKQAFVPTQHLRAVVPQVSRRPPGEDTACPKMVTVLFKQRVTSLLLPNPCQNSSAPTRGELGKNEYWTRSESALATLIIHSNFDKSARNQTKKKFKELFPIEWNCYLTTNNFRAQICFPMTKRNRNHRFFFLCQHICARNENLGEIINGSDLHVYRWEVILSNHSNLEGGNFKRFWKTAKFVIPTRLSLWAKFERRHFRREDVFDI